MEWVINAMVVAVGRKTVRKTHGGWGFLLLLGVFFRGWFSSSRRYCTRDAVEN